MTHVYDTYMSHLWRGAEALGVAMLDLLVVLEHFCSLFHSLLSHGIRRSRLKPETRNMKRTPRDTKYETRKTLLSQCALS